MASGLRAQSFGPFGGIVDAGNAERLERAGAFRRLMGGALTGLGSVVSLDGIGAACPTVGEVLAVATLGTTLCLAVWEPGTGVRLYKDTLVGSLSSPTLVGTLWATAVHPLSVTMEEGLGVLYIASARANDGTTLNHPTKTYDGAAIATLQANVGFGVESCYFLGVTVYNQHLWGWGWGGNNAAGAATAYRPELLRYSGPNFTAFSSPDSITVGNNVRAGRERVVSAARAGDAILFGSSGLATRVVGYGRNSWQKDIVDGVRGPAGFQAMCAAGRGAYLYARGGLFAIGDAGEARPVLAGRAEFNAWEEVVDPTLTILAYDPESAHVLAFGYGHASANGAEGAQLTLVYDERRDEFYGPSTLPYRVTCAGRLEAGALTLGQRPAGLPSITAVTYDTSVYGTPSAPVLVVAFTAGDATMPTLIEVKETANGRSMWRPLVHTLGTGASGTIIVDLATNNVPLLAATAYSVRATHVPSGYSPFGRRYPGDASGAFTTPS